MEQKRFIRWTDKERDLLAHLVSVAFEANGNENVLEACRFAASKLGRSVDACTYQYNTYCKGKTIDKRVEDLIVELPIEQPKYTECVVEVLHGTEHYVIRHFENNHMMIKVGSTVILLKLQESSESKFNTITTYAVEC